MKKVIFPRYFGVRQEAFFESAFIKPEGLKGWISCRATKKSALTKLRRDLFIEKITKDCRKNFSQFSNA
jgi:hypothetical protein